MTDVRKRFACWATDVEPLTLEEAHSKAAACFTRPENRRTKVYILEIIEVASPVMPRIQFEPFIGPKE